MALVKELEHLKISLDVIKLATNSFGAENLIGIGGFGKVYKGDILAADGRTKTVAIKRLDGRHGQGEREFLREIMMLSSHRHDNLASLVGFCDEKPEKILVYEHEFNGSLEKHLDNKALTWVQRLKICIGAARGLEYLHNPLGSQQRVLHRDVKSSNVLLDEFWDAKISDFGLSKIGPANQEYTFLVSQAVGTLGYCDPIYLETSILTKESDVYSFGVVLFEVICGRLCVRKNDENERLLIPLAQRSYEQGILDGIIFDGLREQTEPNSLKTFAEIAYRCVKREREERPTMADVLGQLELAYEYQESYESGKPMEYEEILQMADREQSLVYSNKRELKLLLSSGILLDWGRRWFSLNESEHNCEMISASEFSFQDPETIDWIPDPKSRFSEVAKFERGQELNIDIDTETVLLTPSITYAAYLLFKYYNDCADEEPEMSPGPIFVGLKYKIKAASDPSISYLAEYVGNGWLAIELCQFISYKKTARLDIFLEGIYDRHSIVLEGIQFLPIEKAKNDDSLQTETADTKVTNEEQKLPSDYRHIIRMAKNHVPYNITNKDLYLLLSNGILINKGQAFFSLDKDGGKCCMQAATSVLKDNTDLLWISVRESRFEKVAKFQSGNDFRVTCHINYHMLSPNTAFAVYLVYKLPQDACEKFECPLDVRDSDKYSSETVKEHLMFLSNPKTPVINVIKGDPRPEKKPLNRPELEGVPKLREDGWMEARVWTFTTDAATATIYKQFDVSFCDYHQELSGLIVQGAEIRPK